MPHVPEGAKRIDDDFAFNWSNGVFGNFSRDYNQISEKTASVMWMMYCRDSYTEENGCRSVNYRLDHNLLTLAAFFKELANPRIVSKKNGK